MSINNLQTGMVTIRMFNITGQEIQHNMAAKAGNLFHFALSPGNVPRGMYFLETRIGHELYHQKVLVNR